MARPLRVEFPGALYHVTARGNERRSVFAKDADRLLWLETLAEMVEGFGVLVHCYCVMGNHYHLVLATPGANLSAAMGWFQTTFTVRYNRSRRRSGHLFQGRFKAQVVDGDAYAQELLRYVHLNPVRIGVRKGDPVDPGRKEELARWRWSSHRAYAGAEKAPGWLTLEWLAYFGRRAGEARRAGARGRGAVGTGLRFAGGEARWRGSAMDSSRSGCREGARMGARSDGERERSAS